MPGPLPPIRCAAALLGERVRDLQVVAMVWAALEAADAAGHPVDDLLDVDRLRSEFTEWKPAALDALEVAGVRVLLPNEPRRRPPPRTAGTSTPGPS